MKTLTVEDVTLSDIAHRSEAVVAAVLPPSAQIRRGRREGRSVDLTVAGKRLRVAWLGEGGLRHARELIAGGQGPDIAAARRMSPGAREALSAAGIGWVDETGAAEIACGLLIVSRSGRTVEAPPKPFRWTPSVLAVAEALLCGRRATVGAMREATGLSVGSATNALRALAGTGLLSAKARRGRNAARRVHDPDRLLEEYAAAAAMPAASLAVGVTWRDFAAGLREVGHRWDDAKIAWATTGAVAASMLAPHLATFATGEVYVDRATVVGLESAAVKAGLRPIHGGRLTLHPFPTVTTGRLAETRGGLRVAPWPRVYADLRTVGVRGEEAAEHLREIARSR